MSKINERLQFQILCYSANIRIAYNSYYKVASIWDFGIVSYNALEVASDATSTDVASAAYDNYTLPINVVRSLNSKLNCYFKAVIKKDQETQSRIIKQAMPKIPIDYKSPKSEYELIDFLLKTNVSKLTPLIQIYHYYSISIYVKN